MPKPVDDAGRRRGADVHRLGFAGDDAALVAALRRGDPGAPASLYDRHAPYLRRVIARVLGVDDEIPEVLQETFAQALASLDGLDDPRRLRAWLVRVAVFTARGVIRKRRRQRWLRFRAPEQVPEAPQAARDPEARLMLRRVYEVVERMPEKERVPFALRYFEGMELVDVADACAVSLATIKRRLKKARHRFAALAERDPLLRERVRASPHFGVDDG
ncbi:MAG: RNA polymerase subunit sigma [Sandaracinus sp.]|nr:RNA polymerase subunit sigma [Myxococcales bacterium]MAT27043.1 RNA polymerase subunit sigma [Sandaracinus sp.]MBJ72425.1 RNA polymerase subunit sigma [Sandaracinus sp.]HJL25977.1 sigma-70 family RNA polymerase sigma factor [Polyangiaceae bacterium LLY-WYZ-15_(1-7)]HJL49392.1 sigma-70 family RNA polymerase sigma factor [Polyangiaceae bacterium LLY-WYZ-15_(1-7)]